MSTNPSAISQFDRPQAILALEDGRVFKGHAFGSTGTTTGEICFNTSMTGYQEIITDPSYRGQIVTLTYPMIGNYGVNEADAESSETHIRGLIIGELSPVSSNFRSEKTLDVYLEENNILGIDAIDTRALTKHLRTAGAMRACISTELSAEEAIEKAKSSPPMEGSDFVKEVGTQSTQKWEGESRLWRIPNASMEKQGYYEELPPVKYHIVAYDFGVKRNILRSMRQQGFEITLVNSRTSAEDVLAMNADGIFLSNGPGDPAALDYIHKEIKKLLGKKPIFGICLGHQILTHAFGGSTYKLKFGHRGGNHPVKDLRTGQVAITAQNHGFATDADSIGDDVEITHINLNDNTIEGFRHKIHPAFSVQHHPEAAPGPNDASYFFKEFVALIEQSK